MAFDIFRNSLKRRIAAEFFIGNDKIGFIMENRECLIERIKGTDVVSR